MNYFKIKLLFFFLSIFVLLAFALPEFTVNIKDKNYRYPSIGFSKIGIPKDFGSFKPSNGIFSSTIIRGIIDFGDASQDLNKDEEAESILKQIKNRALAAGLYDLEINLEESSKTTYYLSITFPNYYTNKNSIASWLVTKGEIIFITDESFQISDADITNVELSYNYPFDTTNGKIYTFNENLRLKLSKDLKPEFDSFILSSSAQSFIMTVDGSLTYQLVPQTKEETPTLRGFLSTENIDLETLIIAMNLTKSYFEENTPLSWNVQIEESLTENVVPEFNPDGARTIAITFIISTILLGLYIMYKYGVRNALWFLLVLTLEITFLIVLLKFFSATLSIGTIIGFIISYLLFTGLNIEIITTDFKEITNLKKSTRLDSILLIIIVILLLMWTDLPGIIKDVFGVVISLCAVIIAISFIYLTTFKQLQLTIKKKI